MHTYFCASFDRHCHTAFSVQRCLSVEAGDRPTCSQLLRHRLFTDDGFADTITRQLRTIVCSEYESNALTAHTMRRRYEHCRQQLMKTAAKTTADETQRTQPSLPHDSTQPPDKVDCCKVRFRLHCRSCSVC